MLINEKKLSMLNPDHRKQIEEAMVHFLFEQGEIEIEGYQPVAPKETDK